MFIKKILKSVFASLCGTYFRLFKQSKLENALTVFVYHDVTDTPSEFSKATGLCVPPAILDFQLKFIKKYFNVITPDDLISNTIPKRAAMVTFDDGEINMFRTALPIIEQNKIPTVYFLNVEPVSGAIFRSGLITYLLEKDEGFRDYLINVVGRDNLKRPLFVNCTREIVGSYMKLCGKDFKDELSSFTGPFANEDDLLNTSESRYIYYANHLYNHDIAITLSDEELKDSFVMNTQKLQSYKNFTNLFAFPFGQPVTTFSERQVGLCLSFGADRVFSSLPVVNYVPSEAYLHRIALTSFNDTVPKIFYQIFYMETIRHNAIFKYIKKTLRPAPP
ncbi:MAG: polysaccharide deacetylase family protein [Candidatus Magnetominusculus sp. LBB02]|nr:polysaccharide deacetylase family protein [Candidatus Magnetominusculus sp. LBB02]